MLQAIGEQQLSDAVDQVSSEWAGAAGSIRLGLLGPPRTPASNGSTARAVVRSHLELHTELVELEMNAPRLALQAEELALLVPCDMAARMVLHTATR